MCTVVVLVRPGHPWPVTIAANRDEQLARAWDPPAAWWPDRPDVIGGRDRSAGGTWMALHRADGVAAAVLNRPGTLGPLAGKRSRGDLPLLAVSRGSAAAGAAAIGALDSAEWRGFNLVVADRSGAFFLRGTGLGRPAVERLPDGVSVVTAHDPNDLDSPRIARHLPRFAAAGGPEPGDRPGEWPGDWPRDWPGDWKDWPRLLGDREGGPQEQLDIAPRGGFGTVCSSLLALPAEGPPVWLFAPGRPSGTAFAAV